MPKTRLAVLPLAALLLCPPPVGAQERATGTVTLDRPPPEPRGAVLTRPDGSTVEIPRGASAEISGANVVVERETPRGTTLTVQNDVLFDFDKDELRPEAAQALGRVSEIIRERRPRAVLVVGHTDSMGADSYNEALSRRRAEAVQSWLMAQNDRMPPLRVAGHGEREPVAPNTVAGRDNPEGRQQNRRVEVVLER
jgi:outer membrane protein OmpA-like peptidoglycan-associated protein